MVRMRTHALLLAASVTTLFTLAVARPANALGPIDLEIAGKLGYGSDHLGLGVGGRAGISIFGLYAGVNLVDYPSLSIPATLAGASVSGSALAYGGEVGFGIKIAMLTIRPLVGFGDLNTSVGGLSSGSFYVQPGGLLQLNFGLLIFGVDAAALIPTASNSNDALTIDGQVGVKF
jgi:hypothetical protein